MQIRCSVRKHFWRSLFFFVGLSLVSLGVTFTIQAKLGVGSWDVLNTGLSNVTSLSIGTANFLVSLVATIGLLFLNRSLLKWGTIFNLLLIGLLMDLFLRSDWIPVAHTLWLQIIWLFLGIITIAFGAALYLSPSYGSGPRDGLMLEFSKRFNLSIRSVRTIMEIIVVTIGWLLGGKVFIGTLVIACTIGPCVQFFLHKCNLWLQQLLQDR
ncbi:hypothetical protein SAMN05444392_103125 [Seinonella peptonophila]|uniref:Membrane protein YczE n=1 Tax=Seinonella peptonophila TaxID=112248 RepID=A0A1M4WAE9_9BACL|nr:hypothetical protein [Seinonella peptonophila]SHE78238.1 hypothetical protein SAMN05444392_103125 [Seinonella peptonophila]